MANSKRTTVNASMVIEMFHKREFNDTVEGIMAEMLWTGWENIIDAVGVAMMIPHRKNKNKFISTFIPSMIRCCPDADDDDVREAIHQAMMRRLPTDAAVFDDVADAVYSELNIPIEYRVYDYRSWALNVYTGMRNGNSRGTTARRWLGGEALRVATLMPNTLARDMTSSEKILNGMIASRYLQFGSQYLAGVTTRYYGYGYPLDADPLCVTATILKFASDACALTESNDIARVLHHFTINRNNSKSIFPDEMSTIILSLLTAKLGHIAPSNKDSVVVVGIVVKYVKALLEEMNAAPLGMDVYMLTRIDLHRFNVATDAYLEENPHVKVVQGKLVAHLKQ